MAKSLSNPRSPNIVFVAAASWIVGPPEAGGCCGRGAPQDAVCAHKSGVGFDYVPLATIAIAICEEVGIGTRSFLVGAYRKHVRRD